MTSPKLVMLQRQLMAEVSTPLSETKRTSDKLITAVTDLVEAESKERVAEAQELVKEEKAENAKLQKTITELRNELLRSQKETIAKFEAMAAKHKQECDKIYREYEQKMMAHQKMIDSLRSQLADEEKAKVKAEIHAAASDKMCADYAKMMHKPAPVQKPAPAPVHKPAPMPREIKELVAKPIRDELGQIVNVIYTPKY